MAPRRGRQQAPYGSSQNPPQDPNFTEPNATNGATRSQATTNPNATNQNDDKLDAEVVQSMAHSNNARAKSNDDTEDDDDNYQESEVPEEECVAPSRTKPAPRKRAAYASSKKPRPRVKESQMTAEQEREREFHARKNVKGMDQASKINDGPKWENQEWEVDEDGNPVKPAENLPPGMARTAKGQIVQANGRVKGRKLVLWHRPRMIEKLILHLQYELHRRGVDIPWNHAVHRLSPGSSGQSATQHLNKLRDHLIAEGHLVPPLCGKVAVYQDPNIRGYVRDMNGPNVTTPRKVMWDEFIEDKKESLHVPGLIRGSGNYRKMPGGQGLDKTAKANDGSRRSRLPPDILAEQQSNNRRTRKRAATPPEDYIEEMPAKRTRSGRALRTRSQKVLKSEPKIDEDSPWEEVESRNVTKLSLSPELLSNFPPGENDPKELEEQDEEQSFTKSDEDSGSEYQDGNIISFDQLPVTTNSRKPARNLGAVRGVAQNQQQDNSFSEYGQSSQSTLHHANETGYSNVPTARYNTVTASRNNVNPAHLAVHGNTVSQSYLQQLRMAATSQIQQSFPAEDVRFLLNNGYTDPANNSNGSTQPQVQNSQSGLVGGSMMQNQASAMHYQGSNGSLYNHHSGGAAHSQQLQQFQGGQSGVMMQNQVSAMQFQDNNAMYNYPMDDPFNYRTGASMNLPASLQPADINGPLGTLYSTGDFGNAGFGNFAQELLDDNDQYQQQPEKREMGEDERAHYNHLQFIKDTEKNQIGESYDIDTWEGDIEI